MSNAPSLPPPVIGDLGPTWEFQDGDQRVRLVSTPGGLKLWVDDTAIDPHRVLSDEEYVDWHYLEEPHVRALALSDVGKPPPKLLALVLERVLRRYRDVRNGNAPEGWNRQ